MSRKLPEKTLNFLDYEPLNKEKIMPGKVLANAAEIIVSAGAQIDALLEKLEDAMTGMLEDRGYKVDILADLSRDKNEWLCTQSMNCFSFEKKGKRNKESYNLNIQVVLHDEQFVGVDRWEPTIFVMYAPDKDAFDIESIKEFIVSENRIDTQDQRLWRWGEKKDDVIDSWMFAVPLVSINSEEDIQKMIVKPVSILLSDPRNTSAAFPKGHSLFKFKWEGDTFSMSI